MRNREEGSGDDHARHPANSGDISRRDGARSRTPFILSPAEAGHLRRALPGIESAVRTRAARALEPLRRGGARDACALLHQYALVSPVLLGGVPAGVGAAHLRSAVVLVLLAGILDGH